MMSLVIACSLGASFFPVPERSGLHLVEQLSTPSVDDSDVDAEATLVELNRRIATLSVNWPVGASLLVATGGIALYVSFLLLPVFLVGGTSGLILLGVAVGAVMLLGIGIAVGVGVSSNARLEREALIRDRDALQRRLDAATRSVPLVQLQPTLTAPLTFTF